MIISSRKFFANSFVVVKSIVNSSSSLINDITIVKTRKFFANVFVTSNLLIFFIDVMIFWKILAISSTSIFIDLSIVAISSISSRQFVRFFSFFALKRRIDSFFVETINENVDFFISIETKYYEKTFVAFWIDKEKKDFFSKH